MTVDSHPPIYVVCVWTVGIGVFPTSNRPFIVMELMSRGNLRTLLQCCSKKEDGRCDEHGRELPLSYVSCGVGDVVWVTAFV